MKSPRDYRTIKGLKKKIAETGRLPMTAARATWLSNAQWCLANDHGLSDKEAAKFVASCLCGVSAYTATA